MHILGYILIIFALADFASSWMGINLTPFLPNAIAQFSPIIISGIGYLLLNAKSTQSGSKKTQVFVSISDYVSHHLNLNCF